MWYQLQYPELHVFIQSKGSNKWVWLLICHTHYFFLVEKSSTPLTYKQVKGKSAAAVLFFNLFSLFRLAVLEDINVLFPSAAKLTCQHDGLIDIEDIFTFRPDFTLFRGRTFASGEQVSFLLLWHIVNTQYSSWHPEAQ